MEPMQTEAEQTTETFFNRWVIATTLGWLLGFVLTLLFAVGWGLVGGRAQFMIGIGMGAGVGVMQYRQLGAWIERPLRWFWMSAAGMGAPFILWDLGTYAGIGDLFSLPACVLAGGFLSGLLQLKLLREQIERPAWWIPASMVGWGVPVAAIAVRDLGLAPGMFGTAILIAALLFGGAILGAVTGKALIWMVPGTESFEFTEKA